MKKNKINNLIEYLSPTLILSYFFIHKIFLVITGIILSIYLINIELFNRIMSSINKNLVTRKSSKVFNKNDRSKKLDSINVKSKNNDSKLTLVEIVEELGYVPSLNKNNERDAA